jgi:hypothetical protein
MGTDFGFGGCFFGYPHPYALDFRGYPPDFIGFFGLPGVPAFFGFFQGLRALFSPAGSLSQGPLYENGLLHRLDVPAVRTPEDEQLGKRLEPRD